MNVVGFLSHTEALAGLNCGNPSSSMCISVSAVLAFVRVPVFDDDTDGRAFICASIMTLSSSSSSVTKMLIIALPGQVCYSPCCKEGNALSSIGLTRAVGAGMINYRHNKISSIV